MITSAQRWTARLCFWEWDPCLLASFHAWLNRHLLRRQTY
jgi:hypothetical protein